MDEPLRLVGDYEHRYTAANGIAAWCRVRVYEPGPGSDDGPVVIFSEPAESAAGPSVTNNAEIIAAEVVLRFALPSSRTAFVEHYPPERHHLETFDLVTFTDQDDPRDVLRGGRYMIELGEPHWEHIDRPQVEELIGGELGD